MTQGLEAILANTGTQKDPSGQKRHKVVYLTHSQARAKLTRREIAKMTFEKFVATLCSFRWYMVH